MIMKKLLGGLAIASLLAMGVGVGVAVNANSRSAFGTFASADGKKTIFLEGMLNSVDCWNTTDDSRQFVFDLVTEKYTLVWHFYAGDTFKLYNKTYDKFAGYTNALPSYCEGVSGDLSDIRIKVEGTYKITLNKGTDDYGDWQYALNAAGGTISSYDPDGRAYIWEVCKSGDWLDAGHATRLHAWGGADGNVWEIPTHTFKIGTYYYHCYSVPTDITGFQFQRYDATYTTGYDYTGNIEGSNIHFNSLYQISGVWDGFSVTDNEIVLENCTAQAFAAAIELLQACDSNSNTGYGAYSTVKRVFYDQMSASEKAKLSSINIGDYAEGAYSSREGSYTGATRSSNASVADKWNALYTASNSGANVVPFTSVSENLTVATVASISIVCGVAAGGAFFFVRKKTMR